MDSEKLTHLIYTSATSPGFDNAELKTVLQVARSNNARRSITGMLLYISGSFFQVLEGDETTLAELFAIIASDVRHRKVTKIIHEPITRRDFGDWTMGFSKIDPSELGTLEGLNDFFQRGDSLTHLPPGRAKKLLLAFTEGRWRMRLEESAR